MAEAVSIVRMPASTGDGLLGEGWVAEAARLECLAGNDDDFVAFNVSLTMHRPEAGILNVSRRDVPSAKNGTEFQKWNWMPNLEFTGETCRVPKMELSSKNGTGCQIWNSVG